MNRLTEDNPLKDFVSLKYTSKKPIYLDYNKGDAKTVEELLNKLGKYEDLDEELGIEYSMLVNASKEGFYTKDFPEPIKPYVDFKNKCFIYILNFVTYKYYFKDYGKTWSFIKERLENV